jgi:adenylate kinase
MGEKGFVLDGFPRTVKQAQDLLQSQDIQLAVNLQLREEVLIEKCMGRRICKKCGKGWNVADIHQPATADRPEIIMPPLDPPVDWFHFMEQRDDDKEDVRSLRA